MSTTTNIPLGPTCGRPRTSDETRAYLRWLSSARRGTSPEVDAIIDDSVFGPNERPVATPQPSSQRHRRPPKPTVTEAQRQLAEQRRAANAAAYPRQALELAEAWRKLLAEVDADLATDNTRPSAAAKFAAKYGAFLQTE